MRREVLNIRLIHSKCTL